MMDELFMFLTFATVTYAIYKLFELFVRRSERLAIINKLSDGMNPHLISGSLNVDLNFNNTGQSVPMRLGLLLVGIGLGIFIVAMVHLNILSKMDNDESWWRYRDIFILLYFAIPTTLGGAGLLIAHLIEERRAKKKYEMINKTIQAVKPAEDKAGEAEQ